MAALLFCFLSDALVVNIALPISPFMIQLFFDFPPDQERKIGYYSGLLAASYTLGQLLTGPIWGSLSDKYGRRPIMMMGLTATVICQIGFGAAESFATAITFRFLQGLLSGNVLVARSYLSDITDSTNEARAFALLGACFGVGGIFGPFLGGVLSFPAQKFPATFAADGLFGQRPFLLPCLVVSAVAAVDLVCAYLFLPETVTLQASKKSVSLEAEGEKTGHDRGIAEGASNSPPKGPQPESSSTVKLLSNPLFRRAALTFALFGTSYPHSTRAHTHLHAHTHTHMNPRTHPPTDPRTINTHTHICSLLDYPPSPATVARHNTCAPACRTLLLCLQRSVPGM
jgi:MFS family permease